MSLMVLFFPHTVKQILAVLQPDFVEKNSSNLIDQNSDENGGILWSQSTPEN